MNRWRDREGPVAPYGDFYHPVSRCRHWGALSPETARPRSDLDPRHDPEFDRLLFAGTIREAEPGLFYLHGVPEDADGRLFIHNPLTRILIVISGGALLVALFRRLAE